MKSFAINPQEHAAGLPGVKLPAGGYIAKIVKAETILYSWGEVLCVSFDIADGPYKGHFTARFKADANSDFGQKWKGVYRLTVPEDGNEHYERQKSAFEHFIWAVQTSNPGYKWDWNEAALKGKWLGVIFRNKEWEFNGKTGWMTECCAVTSAQAIRAGEFQIPADKPLKRAASAQASAPAAQASPLDLFAAPAAPAASAPADDGLIAGEECPF